RHRQRAADAARGGHGNVAAPQIAGKQIAGAGRPLVKPFQLRRAGSQIERKRPAAEDHFRFGEDPVALLAGSLTGRVSREIARRGVGGPGVAVFAVEPAAGIDQLDRRIDRRDPGLVPRADSLGHPAIEAFHNWSRTRRFDQRLLAPICATASISTLSEGSASAATCTSVEAGKLPVKNSRRACHPFSRWLMSVTKIVTLTISPMLPPAASTMWRILVKIAFAWA